MPAFAPGGGLLSTSLGLIWSYDLATIGCWSAT